MNIIKIENNEMYLTRWAMGKGAEAEAEMQEICGCGARKTHQCDREGNIINEPICPDCEI